MTRMDSRSAYLVSLALGAAVIGGCGTPQIVTPDRIISRIDWTQEELAKEKVIRTLRTTEQASYHLLRTTKSEPLHVHDNNELTVVLLSGKGTMHLGGKSTKVTSGDVFFVPKGAAHWFELESSVAEAYLVCTPPMGKNFRRIIKGKVQQ